MKPKQGSFQKMLVFVTLTVFSLSAFSQIYQPITHPEVHPSARPAKHEQQNPNCLYCSDIETTDHSHPSSPCACHQQDPQNLITQEPATFVKDQPTQAFVDDSVTTIPQGDLSIPTKPPTNAVQQSKANWLFDRLF